MPAKENGVSQSSATSEGKSTRSRRGRRRPKKKSKTVKAGEDLGESSGEKKRASKPSSRSRHRASKKAPSAEAKSPTTKIGDAETLARDVVDAALHRAVETVQVAPALHQGGGEGDFQAFSKAIAEVGVPLASNGDHDVGSAAEATGAPKTEGNGRVEAGAEKELQMEEKTLLEGHVPPQKEIDRVEEKPEEKSRPRTPEGSGGFWTKGEQVDTVYGRGLIVALRADGSVKVALQSWTLAQGATVQCFLRKSALRKTALQLGDHVATTYGRGRLVEMRTDGSLVVRLSSWKLAGDSRPMLYLRNNSMVSSIEEASLCQAAETDIAVDSPMSAQVEWTEGDEVDTVYGQGSVVELRADGIAKVALHSWKLAQDATVHCFLQLGALRKTTEGGHQAEPLKEAEIPEPVTESSAEVSAQEEDGAKWAKGDEALTVYGSGIIDDVREDGVVKVVLNSWKLALGAPVKCFLQKSALRRPSICVGEEVVTSYGRGVLVERRANHSVVVRLESWKLAKDSRPILYLRDESLITKASPRTLEELTVEERLSRVLELREGGNTAFISGDIDAAVECFAECLGILASLQEEGSQELGTSQKARTLSSWIPVCLMMARCVYKKEQYKKASAHAQNAYDLCKALCENPTTPVFFRIVRLLSPEDPQNTSIVLGRWPMSALIVNVRSKLKLADFAGAEQSCKLGLNLEMVEPKQKEELAKLYKKAKTKVREEKKREQVVAQRMFSSTENGKKSGEDKQRRLEENGQSTKISANEGQIQSLIRTQMQDWSKRIWSFFKWDSRQLGFMAAAGLGFSGILLLRMLRRRR